MNSIIRDYIVQGESQSRQIQW